MFTEQTRCSPGCISSHDRLSLNAVMFYSSPSSHTPDHSTSSRIYIQHHHRTLLSNTQVIVSMDSAGAPQDVVLQSMTYDGASVFLQGENDLSIKIQGVVVTERRLVREWVDVEVIATFAGYHSTSEMEMNCIFESNTITFVERDPESGKYIYHFKANYQSSFNGPYSGDIELNATVMVDNEFGFPPFHLASATVISYEDQDNNRARQVAIARDPLMDDQGPGLYSGRAEDSSFYRDPVVPIPEMGDQGYGEYIGPGEDANWEADSPSPSESSLSMASSEVRFLLGGDSSESAVVDGRSEDSDDFASDTFDDAPRDISEDLDHFFD